MEVAIVKGSPISKYGARLNHIALDYMAQILTGSKDPKVIGRTLEELWKQKANRFSHEFAYEAQLGKETVGLITCYPVSVMNRLAWPTFVKLLMFRKWDIVKYSTRHLREFLSMITLHEGREGEYHIGSLAAFPESRGYGIGTKLITFAEEQAKQKDYRWTSLTVRKENVKALKLYERLGYIIADSIDKKPYSLYRMVKKIY